MTNVNSEQWVLNAKGDDSLTHVSELYFPPENNIAAVWTHSSVAGAFHAIAHAIAHASANARSEHLSDGASNRHPDC